MNAASRFFLPAILLITAFLFGPSLRGSFVYDDHGYIEQNTAIHRLNPWPFFVNAETLASASSGLAQDSYRPLTVFSHALVFKWAGLQPSKHRLVNIGLFLFCGWLLVLLARDLLQSEHAALLAGAVFLWHPVQVQSVVWIAQRSTVLGGAFALSSLYLLYTTRGSSKREGVGIGLFLAAIFAKEIMIVMPGLLWLLLRWDKKTKPRPLFYPIRLWVALGLCAGIYLLVRTLALKTWSMTPELQPNHLFELGLGILAFPTYLGKLIVPVALRANYAYPGFNPIKILWSALFLLSYLGTLLMLWRKHRPLAVMMGWVLIGLLPALHLLPLRAYVLERALFVPLIGFSLWIGLVYRDNQRSRPWIHGVLLVYALLSYRQIPHWGSDRRLWQENVRIEPDNPFARACYAESLGDDLLAEKEYRQVLLSHPPEGIQYAALQNLAALNYRLGRLWKAHYWKGKAEAVQGR